MRRIAFEVILQTEFEPCLEHGHRRLRVYLLHRQQDLDGLGLQFPIEIHFLEHLTAAFAAIDHILVLTIGIMPFAYGLCLVFHVGNSLRIGHGLPTVSAGNEPGFRHALLAIDVDGRRAVLVR